MYERTNSNDVSMKTAKQAKYAQANSQINVKSSSFLGKVYGYMAIALLITFAVGLGSSYLLSSILTTGTAEEIEAAATIGLIGIIASVVVLLVCSLIISIGSVKSKMNITIPGILYCAAMGFLCSFIFLEAQEISPFALPSAFAITAMVFGILYFIGKIVKNMNPVAQLALGLLFGAAIIGLLLLILWPLAASGALGSALTTTFLLIYVAIDAIFFIAILLICAYDVWRIQKIADAGNYTKNLALYCAFVLYQDFMYILIRVLRILIVLFANSKK